MDPKSPKRIVPTRLVVSTGKKASPRLYQQPVAESQPYRQAHPVTPSERYLLVKIARRSRWVNALMLIVVVAVIVWVVTR
jgi:hypothetical protein